MELVILAGAEVSQMAFQLCSRDFCRTTVMLVPMLQVLLSISIQLRLCQIY
jgi:hypothetical protein